MAYSAEIFTAGIVVLGDFNPAIFSPDWLERNGLMGQADAEFASKSESLVLSRQVAIVDSPWFVLQVVEDQFSLTGKGALTPALRDLASGIFSLLSHTPVRALGMNFMGHYKIHDTAAYHKFGDVLAPKGPWEAACGIDGNVAIGLTNMSVRIQEGTRDSSPVTSNAVNISVQPSTVVQPTGIYFQYNDHRDIAAAASDKLISPANVVVDVLDGEWEPSWHLSSALFSNLLTEAIGE